MGHVFTDACLLSFNAIIRTWEKRNRALLSTSSAPFRGFHGSRVRETRERRIFKKVDGDVGLVKFFWLVIRKKTVSFLQEKYHSVF